MKYGLLGSSGRIAMQVPAFKLSACSRVTGNPSIIRVREGLPTTQSKWLLLCQSQGLWL
jgi:hypothetical protein